MLTRDARKVIELQARVAEEQRKRLAAEQRAAGLRSAVVRMQAALAKQKAEDLERKAERVG